MNIEIKQVTTQAEREQVFRLRYRVYVEEIGAQMTYADHAHKKIEEPLDRQGTILGAFLNGGLVGSVRINWGWQDIGACADYYGMRVFEPYFPKKTTMTTRLVVAPEARRSTVAMSVIMAWYSVQRAAGVCFDFIDCRDDVKPMFLKLGYRQVLGQPVRHPESGDLHYPLVLVHNDAEYLTRVRSPFRRVFDEFPPNVESVGFFYSTVLSRTNQLALAA